MNNSEIFRQVAEHRLTPEEGVKQMASQDAQARAQMRPRWMPIWIWAVCAVLFSGVLAACGVQSD